MYKANDKNNQKQQYTHSQETQNERKQNAELFVLLLDGKPLYKLNSNNKNCSHTQKKKLYINIIRNVSPNVSNQSSKAQAKKFIPRQANYAILCNQPEAYVNEHTKTHLRSKKNGVIFSKLIFECSTRRNARAQVWKKKREKKKKKMSDSYLIQIMIEPNLYWVYRAFCPFSWLILIIRHVWACVFCLNQIRFFYFVDEENYEEEDDDERKFIMYNFYCWNFVLEWCFFCSIFFLFILREKENNKPV